MDMGLHHAWDWNDSGGTAARGPAATPRRLPLALSLCAAAAAAASQHATTTRAPLHCIGLGTAVVPVLTSWFVLWMYVLTPTFSSWLDFPPRSRPHMQSLLYTTQMSTVILSNARGERSRGIPITYPPIVKWVHTHISIMHPKLVLIKRLDKVETSIKRILKKVLETIGQLGAVQCNRDFAFNLNTKNGYDSRVLFQILWSHSLIFKLKSSHC